MSSIEQVFCILLPLNLNDASIWKFHPDFFVYRSYCLNVYRGRASTCLGFVLGQFTITFVLKHEAEFAAGSIQLNARELASLQENVCGDRRRYAILSAPAPAKI
jgi:hypothetical protein